MGLRTRSVLPLLLAACCAGRAEALDRITFEAEEATASAGTGTRIRAVLDLTAPEPKLELAGAEVRASGLEHPFTDVRLSCDRIVLREPYFACEQGTLRAAGSSVGAISMRARGDFDSATSVLNLDGSGLALAGGVLAVDVKSDALGWTATGHAERLALAGVRQLAAPWMRVPKAYRFDGLLDGDFMARNIGGKIGSGARGTASLEARVSSLALTNDEGSIVTQDLDAGLDLRATGTPADAQIELGLHGTSGQALAGPVFLDLKANPLELTASTHLRGRSADVEKLEIHQTNLIDAQGSAKIALTRAPQVESAHIDVQALKFPAAYTSLMQISLAATDFGALQMKGMASGNLDIAANAVTAVNLASDSIDIADAKKNVSFDGLQPRMHWSAAGAPTPAPSMLAWARGAAYGVSGGATQLDFQAQGEELTLLTPARVPIFDGAVVVNSLKIKKPGDDAMDLDFDAQIEPISMSKLSRAFGWPELAGSLSGRIPGLTYHNHELALAGDLEAHVFDGTIVARNLRLQNPLGPWPRFFADITARDLDLDLLTHTFPIGSITGRVDLDMHGLELFDWSPVALDTKIFTSPGDRSRHRISQRAISSISGIGGGGGNVTAALRSGFLRFFDTFHYDRLGLACQLRNDVCLMSGIEPTKTGYYIVKGGGLPRIDIIGNAGRVDWSTLLAQLEAGMHSQNIIVR